MVQHCSGRVRLEPGVCSPYMLYAMAEFVCVSSRARFELCVSEICRYLRLTP